MDDVYVHYMDGWMMYAFFHIIFLGRFLDFFRQIFRIFCVCMLCLYVCMYVHMYVCLYAKHMQRKCMNGHMQKKQAIQEEEKE